MVTALHEPATLATQQYNTTLLEGTGYRIWPYARGLFRGDALHLLWQAMAEEEALGRVFYEAEHTDLETLINYFDTRSCLLFLVVDGTNLMGAVWFTDVRTYRASIGIFYRKAFQGPRAREATDKACRFCADVYHWPQIIGLTPWRAAVRHGQAIGFRLLATLPGFVAIRGKAMPLYIVRRQFWQGGQTHARNGR